MEAPVALLLAGGFSTRFGRDKLLAPLADGTPLAVAAARRFLAAGLAVHAVLRPAQALLRELLRQAGVTVHVSADCQAGMGASLAAGIAATATAGGWIVGLADMPFVAVDTIRAVRLALEGGASIAAPLVNGRRGHPVGFASHFGAHLQRLSGDEGARRLVESAGDALLLVPCDDAGALRDIDRPGDLAEEMIPS